MKNTPISLIFACFTLMACGQDDTGNDGSSGNAETVNGDGDGDTGDGDGDTGDGDGDGDGDTGTDGGPEPVDLGAAGDFAILAKAGISTTGATAIVGDLGLSPADSTYITGFNLSAPPTTFSTSDLVTGKVFAADYDPPTPTELNVAVSAMEAAYSDAAGRTLPDFTELGAGNIDGLTLVPGLYKWGTGLDIPNGVTLSGGPNDVWIFQIADNLVLGNGAMVVLSDGADPNNVFWQVAGLATMGTTSSFEGILLTQTMVEFNTGAVMTGRVLAQTAVTLDATTITSP